MRPVSGEQDTAKYPLDELLGAQANVRLLRVLTEEVDGPISVGDAAQRAGLTVAGARRALKRLAATGFVLRIGGGRGQQFALRDPEPVVRHLKALFRAESDRYQALVTSIRQMLQGLPEIQTAWIDSPPTRAGQPLHIGFLSDARSLTYLVEEIRRRVAPVEEEFDLTIESHAFSKADRPEVSWDTTELLIGHIESAPSGSGDHRDRDRRALHYSVAIAGLLDRDASLAKRARKHLEALLENDQGSASHDLHEWYSILSRYSHHRLREFLISDTPRAQRLRQSSPFFAVLTAEERDDLLAALEETRES